MLVVIVLLCLQHIAHSQVFTRILGEGEKIYDHVPWHFLQTPEAESLPPIDVEAVLKQDARDSTITARFGIKEPMGLTQEDGVFYTFGNYGVWKLKIRSENAKSLNFEFSNLNLPDGSRMFIYGMDGRMLHGPIEADRVHDGIYASDIVLGDYAVIDVYLPEGTTELFSINIDSAVHGIDDALTGGMDDPGISTRAFGDAEPCNVNTACPAGNGWENQIDAVCLILRNTSVEHCTGTLIANACNDLTPFLLTANHCVDGENLNTFVFRFNYESITCPSTVEPHPSVWISFTGAMLRASSAASDFALLQLNSPVAGTNGISFAGWDRTATIPPASTYIHHPSGDVKKITFDAGPCTITGSFFDFTLSPGTPASGDFGTLEGGSSGCPQFNGDRRIVGQQSGGTPRTILCTTTTSSNTNGRFFSSWTGGGTNATRLSNWLGDGINPMTTDAVLIPSVAGGNVVCTTAKTFTLQNPLPGYAVSWAVSPSSLFGSPTSGNGAGAVLWAANASSKGSATLTYTLVSDDCGEQIFTKNIWVGKPSLTGIRAPGCFSPSGNYILTATSSGAEQHTWEFPDCGSGSGGTIPGCWNYLPNNGNNQQAFVQAGNQPPAGQPPGTISVTATNECGSTTVSLPIIWCDEGGSGGMELVANGANGHGNKLPDKVAAFPNPVRGTLSIKLAPSDYLEKAPKSIQLLDVNGRPLYDKVIFGTSLKIDTRGFPAGIYFLKVKDLDGIVTKKIIIL